MKEIRYTKTYIALLFVLAALTVTIISSIVNVRKEYETAYNVPVLKRENIAGTKVNKLMIVAHPDDELLWGGGHLKDGGYLVVCLTKGYDKMRRAEFEKVVTESGNEPLILYYPDKVAGKKDNWEKVRQCIINDLTTVMEYKKWNLIVTHNAQGEYGHIQHKNTYRLVKAIYNEKNIDSNLFFFGKYYRKSKLKDVEDELVSLDSKKIEFKEKLAPYYVSQKKIIKRLWHMARYEMWEKYDISSGDNL